MLTLNDVCFSTPKRQILQNVSFDVPAGEIIVITGPNGSGKSTLAKLIAGVEQPSSGHIFFNDTDLTKSSCTDHAKAGIAFSFQQPVRFKGVTVQDLLFIASTGEQSLYQTKTARVDKYLKQVGLDPAQYLAREIDDSLSGGELKRIEIASVIARHAPLTIFDEPEAGIDIWSFNRLMQVFKKLQKTDDSRSLLIISHQKKLMTIADRIIVLRDGRIVDQGTATKVLPRLEELSC
ncbi:ATP-binding cassette domain-containing protein [Candidatus Saccharibacteria bacterium]|nr:ATP-binding cassette domain-containing protein [Candidatus Saccharibacteria bacterium]